jgi:hypothetical protein
VSQQMPSHKVFDAVAVSSTNTVYSGSKVRGSPLEQGTTCPNGRTLSYVGQFTGTPNGTLTVEGSNSSDQDCALGTDIWVTNDQVTGSGFTLGVATVTSGQINSAAKFAIALTRHAFLRSRLKYVNASGSGTITAVATSKAV